MIRTMTISDYPAVSQLWQQTPGLDLNYLDDSKIAVQRFLKRNPTSCFVKEINQTIVGAILAGHDGRNGHIYHLVVAQDYQKQGFGSQLVEAVNLALAEVGINQVSLTVLKENPEANLFWKNCGFALKEDLAYRSLPLENIQRLDN